MRLIAAFLILMFGFVGTAHAHDTSEIESFEGRWLRQVRRQGLSLELASVRADFMSRHLWYYRPQPKPATTPASSSPVPVPDLTPAPVSAGVEQWRSLVAAYFPASEVERALCIMGHESGGNPGANNPSSSAAGLFQFLRSTWDQLVPSSVTGGSYDSGRVYDPTANVAAAAWLQGADGWHHWSPWNRGLCR